MGAEDPLQLIDARIAQVQADLAWWRKLRDLAIENPDKLKSLLPNNGTSCVANDDGANVLHIQRESRHRSHFDIVCDCLGAAKHPLSAAEIMRETGLARGAVGVILYGKQRSTFTSVPNPDGGRGVRWRLRKGVTT